MLSIRMQRIGRKGHPTYRIVVQDSRQAPTSGKFVASLGSYDPHTKVSSLQKDRASFYLENGAQPTDRVVRLLNEEKVRLPKWVKQPTKQKRAIKNPEKLRRNRPAEPENSSDTSTDENTEDSSVAPDTKNESPEKPTVNVEEKPEAEEQTETEEEKPEQEETKDQKTEESDDSGKSGGKQNEAKDAKTV